MAFWKKIFKSKYTGAEIDAAIAKAGDATKVTANPTLAGTEAALEGLQVGNTKYKVGDSPVTLTLPSTNLGVTLLQVLQFYSGLSDGDLKYKSIWVNKSNNEAGFNDLVAVVTGCQENINNKTFVDFGGTGSFIVQVSDSSVSQNGYVTVNFIPFPQGTRIIGNLLLYYDPTEGSEGVAILLYGAKYEDVT